MKGDTSIQRILLIIVLSVLTLPYVMQVLLSRGSLLPDEAELETLQWFTELKSIRNLVTHHQNQTNQWPQSLNELIYNFGKPRYQELDLSIEFQITSTPGKRIKSNELQGSQIVLKYGTGWHCVPDKTTIPDAYKPIECGGSLRSTTQRSLPSEKTMHIIAIIALLGIVIGVVFYHPTIRLLRGREFSLATQRLVDLRKLSLLTRLSGLQPNILQANDLNSRSWQKVATFRSLPAKQKINWFKRVWPTQQIKNVKPQLFHVQLDPEFVLNMDNLYLYMADKGISINRIKSHLKQANIDHQAVLIWAEDPALSQQLQVHRSRFQQPVLLPNQQQMTQLLVAKYASQTWIDLMVSFLPINQLSPYQGKGGILKSSHFYGREHILDQLKNNTQSCFLLVGGRQLGKTSILKAYERLLKHSARHHCFYISMSDDRLMARLAYHLKITEYADLTDLLNQYHQLNPGIELVLLLDETDRFIATEVTHDFPLLAEVRACAEQGLGQMVFAGFWDLYASAVLDYQSPIRNFAEVITVGALQAMPAKRLLTEPMTVLKQHYSNQEVIEYALNQTGHRANLLNLIGESLVEQLAQKAQPIDQTMIDEALQSQTMFDALQGWSQLTRDPDASALDRMVVYLTFIHQQIDLTLILQHLQQAQVPIDAEQLKQALQRLRLAHILEKNNDHYCFSVPLFTQQHSVQEAKALLAQECQNHHS